MARGGPSAYAAISARVRAMYASQIQPADFDRLGDAADLPSLIAQLKQTAYGPFLEDLKDRDLAPRRVLVKLKRRLAETHASVIRMAPEITRPLLTQLYRGFEVANIKAVLRGILSRATWERMEDVLFPFGPSTTVPAREMLESGSVTAAVDLLRASVYAETLAFAIKRFTAEENLFPLEVALDLEYWRRLWREARRLPGRDREQALRIVGSLIDTNNLTWVIRYRVYHDLSEEELINYTLPFGHHVRDEDVRAIAAGADIGSIVERIYPGLTGVDELLVDPRRGLPRLELLLKRHLMKRCMESFVGDPFHIGLPLAYLVLCDLEIQDLTVLIEAKASGLPAEAYRPFILKPMLAGA